MATDAPVPSKNIVWLASYPKSGNTWFRVFLTNLTGAPGEVADINALDRATIASARPAFDSVTGIEAGDLTSHEVDLLRPRVYEAWSATVPGETLFHKMHDAYGHTLAGEPLVSVEATRGAIYLVRNPLDVCVSYAHHSNTTVEASVVALCDPGHAFCAKPGRLHNQLRQRLSTWSDHVRSWMNASEIPVHVLRYEDMKQHPLQAFTAAVSFAGLDYDSLAIAKAIELSAFERLREQESASGFREKSRKAKSFFRRGEVGAWRDALTPDQVSRIVDCHSDVMRDLGYLVDGCPVDAPAPAVLQPAAHDSP